MHRPINLHRRSTVVVEDTCKVGSYPGSSGHSVSSTRARGSYGIPAHPDQYATT
ncbi:hypothetical protein PISMIDRAFT_686304 [Pisolithus microcarpus 441]|uniref:Uncharacterized protein n=1 Tax=Pisolithus microcarpus 441 TaxID=765257 RepID=A0A0C9YIM2_9AGAM|nr:hypothetical protein PISMIDRAFT_686304 [Pisolithus microcarpus 441]